jgi:hypothetical protein
LHREGLQAIQGEIKEFTGQWPVPRTLVEWTPGTARLSLNAAAAVVGQKSSGREHVMKKVVLFAALICLSLMPTSIFAADSGTAAEAKALLEKAVAELKANEKAAIDKFNKADGGFKDRDLYVFCFNAADGKITAHPSLIGTDVRALKEKSGKAFGEDIYAAAATEGKINTVAYMFPRPGTTEPVAKESFVTKVGSQGCGVGYYK